MPLKKVLLKAGVNRENTRYTNEGGWYESEKVRFRQGTPEKIGGWSRLSEYTYLGVCRSLWNWVTIGGQNLVGVGTNLKFYIERGGQYKDITPIRSTVTLTDPFATLITAYLVTVTDVAHGGFTGDFVTFSGATAVGGLTLNGEFEITVINDDSYSILSETAASSTASGGGTVTAAYQINTGYDISIPVIGWGAGGYGLGAWGFGETSNERLRLWSQSNFGEDLIFAYRNGPLFLWEASLSVDVRATYLSAEIGASAVPSLVLYSFVSDINRFVFAFGCTPLGDTTLDPMLIRWSDQENPTYWTPSATNQAGDLRLSHGSEIVTAMQSRQEILVWTDSTLYGLQYLGAPEVWGAQLLGDNLSIASQNSTAFATGVAYWMGHDKFYKYDGTVAPLRCDLRKFIFTDFNFEQYDQVTAGTNEAFNEIWWFYCTSGSIVLDRYVVYNYLEDIWYYGNMGRTAWADSGLREYPMAATYSHNLVNHEFGNDDNITGVAAPIHAFITSAQFDLDDGHNFNFIWRVLPDVTFEGSTADAPAGTMTLLPLANSGSGYNSPLSQGGSSNATITRTAVVPVEQFTGQVFIRVRGRQMAMKMESDALGVAWQLGSPRLDMRPDGRR
jgi:hypothetical protein